MPEATGDLLPTVACQLGFCGGCPDPLDCTCTCHIDEQEAYIYDPEADPFEGHEASGIVPPPGYDEDSDEARDARSEQAHESRYGLHREGFADND